MVLYKFAALLLCVASLAVAHQPSSAPAPVSPAQPVTDPVFPPARKIEARGSQVVAILRTSMTSKNAHEGAPVKMSLRKDVVLAGGVTLPKGTTLTGKITGASPHQKGKANGALMLLIDNALVKDGTLLPLHIEIEGLAPSVESETARITLPDNNGHHIGGSSNSGGGGQLLSELSDSTGLRSNIRQSGLPDIYLRPFAGSSGVLFALNEDVFLDSGVQVTLQIDERKQQ